MQSTFTRLLLLAGFLFLLLPSAYAQHKSQSHLTGTATSAGTFGHRGPSTCSSCYADQQVVSTVGTENMVMAPAPHRKRSNIIAALSAAYLRSTVLPWGSYGDGTNTAAMDEVFGTENWDSFFFQTASAADVFAPSRKYIFMEGGDLGTATFSSFLQANQAVVENWVAAGGHLFINVAPNQGGSLELGFGGTTLSFEGKYYSTASFTGTVVGNHPIAAGPFTPAGIEYTGGSFSHGIIDGPTISAIIEGTAGVSLGYTDWGQGFAFFGSMTTDGFHRPVPNSHNLLKNILAYRLAPACTSPALTVAAALTASNTPGQCGAAVPAAFEASATGSPTPDIVYSVNGAPISPEFLFPIGSTTVTATATNTCGTDAKTFTVQVTDTELPTITAPAAVSVGTSPGQCAATRVALSTAIFADNCAGTTVSNDAPATFPKGTTTVTWTATDAADNKATATQTVTVTDQEKPTVTAPAAVSVSTDAGQCSATSVNLGTAGFGDNCPGTVISNNAPTSYPKGVTTVTWTATDAAGNTATATQTVTVTDQEKPTVTAPTAVNVNTSPGQCSATNVALGTATFADNCAGTAVSNDAPASFTKGTTTVTWTATDAAGNTATATQTVTVTDREKPMLTAPATISVSTSPGQCAATSVALGTAIFADNCAGTTVSNDAPATFPKGATTVTWTATDAAGNVATATQTVTVTDQQKPTLTLPANLVVNASATATSAAATFSPTATDNCGAVTVVSTPASGSTFPMGATTVSVKATDGAGNVTTGTFTVTVQDVTPPTVRTRAVTVTLVNSVATVSAAQINDGSSDASGIASFTLNRTSFSCANRGENTVTLTVTDVYGNSASATAVVNVVGATPPPTITAVASGSRVYTGGVVTNLYLGYGSQSVTLTASGGTSYVWSPAAGLSTSTGASTVFTAKAAGTYTYTVTATNQTGCTSSATVRLRVVDATCGNKNDKVTVCHNGHEICISPNAVEAHLTQHDDYLGSCVPASTSAHVGGNNLVAHSDQANATAKEGAVLEAFPNPFSTSTTVHFRTAATAPTQVRIIDQLGRVMSVLFNGVAETGRDYTFQVSAEQLATGLYVCEIVSQGQVQAQRLSVIK